MGIGTSKSQKSLGAINASVETIDYWRESVITPPIMTLIKDIMPDLEKGNRTAEHLAKMKIGEFNKATPPNDFRTMGTAMIMSSMGAWPSFTITSIGA